MSAVVDLKQRRYEAASKSTRTKNWLTPSTDANAAINHAQTIRNRARDLVRNNPWAAKGVSVIVNNTIGYGIRCQWIGSSKRASKLAQDKWRAWAETTECDAQGLTDFYGIQQLVVRSVVETGECLIRLRPRLASDKLTVPIQLQVLETDYFYEGLDGKKLSTGGYIQKGIEYDAIGRRVAYYLYKDHPGGLSNFYQFVGNTGYSRVPAYEMIHLFRTDRPGQERGVSWLAPVMIRLRELDIYEDAYLNRQKLANLFAAFITTDNPDETEDEFSDISELTPGAMYLLKTGRRMEFSNPPAADDYGPYTLANLKAIAAGLGITYEALTGDLSQVNFSSARMGWQEFGRSIDSWRWQLIIPRLCMGVAQWFKDYASLPDAKPTWTPPARVMVDPAREVPAIQNAIRSGLMTGFEAIREQGYDPEQQLDEIAEFNAALDQRSIILDSDPRKTAASGNVQTNPSNQNDNTNQTNS